VALAGRVVDFRPTAAPLMPPEVMRDWTALSSSRRACRAAAHVPLGAAAAAAAARTLLGLRTIRWRLGRWRFARRLRVAERKHNGLMVLGRKHHGLLGQQHSPSQRRKPQCRVVSTFPYLPEQYGSSDTKYHRHRDLLLLSTRNPPHKPPSNAKGVEAKGKSHEEWLWLRCNRLFPARTFFLRYCKRLKAEYAHARDENAD
jgi:hypothetical protein